MSRPAKDPWMSALHGGEAPIYLLHGEEPLFAREAAEWLRKRSLEGAIEDFNLDRVNAASSQLDVGHLVNAARTPPMMADKRVIWVQRAELLNVWPKERLEPLLDYIKAPDTGTCFIFEATTKLDKKRALYKALSKKGAPVVMIEQSKLKGEELTRYALREAKHLGLSLNEEAMSLLQAASEDDLSRTRDALHKLKLYVGERAEVSAEDVKALLPEAGLQAQIWDLADLVLERNKERVLEITRALLSALPSQSERSGLTILLHSLLVKRVEGAMVAQALRKTGGGAQELATLTGMHPYGAKKLMQSLSKVRFSPAELARAVRLLLHAEHALKGHKLPNELILEQLLLELCLL